MHGTCQRRDAWSGAGAREPRRISPRVVFRLGPAATGARDTGLRRGTGLAPARREEDAR